MFQGLLAEVVGASALNALKIMPADPCLIISEILGNCSCLSGAQQTHHKHSL